MRTALTIAAALTWTCRQVARLVGLLLLVLAAVIIYDVVGRKFFATGSFKLQELEWHLHGAIAVLAFGYAYARDGHVRIDIFAGRFSARTKIRMEFWAIVLLLIPFLILMLWFGLDFAERSFARGETSSGGIGLSNRWIIKSAIPLSAALTLCGATAVALRCLVALRRPDLLADPFVKEGLWTR